MPVSSYSDMVLKLPQSARSELFQSGRHFPLTFLESMVKQASELFPAWQPENETREIIRKKLKLCDFIHQYGEEFFETDKHGNVQIPASVWEVMGGRLDLLSPQEWGDGYSEEAKSIMADVFKLRNDPYPKEETYASNEGRFTYLVNIAYGSQEVILSILEGTLEEEQLKAINLQFIQPTRTIEPSSSELEDFIIDNIRIIEFMLDHEGSPYLWPVKLMREAFASEEPVMIGDMIERAGVSDSEKVKQLFAELISKEQHDRYLSSAEAIYTVLQFNVGPLRALKDFYSEIPEDIIIFGLVANSLDDPEERLTLAQIFGQDFVDEQMTYLRFIAESKRDPVKSDFNSIREIFQTSHDNINSVSGNLSPKTQGLLLDFLAARSFVEIERINLALHQDPFAVPNVQAGLVQMKARLLTIRNDYMRPPHPMQSEDLRDFLRELQAETWNQFDYISRIHQIGRSRIQFVRSDTGPKPDTPV